RLGVCGSASARVCVRQPSRWTAAPGPGPPPHTSSSAHWAGLQAACPGQEPARSNTHTHTHTVNTHTHPHTHTHTHRPLTHTHTHTHTHTGLVCRLHALVRSQLGETHTQMYTNFTLSCS